MQPTEILIEEHRIIERMLMIVDTLCDQLEKGENIKIEHFRKAVDFIKNFADKCHHAKEEDILFTMLVEKGMRKDAGPIGVMLAEHKMGRDFVKNLNEALDKYEQGDKAAKEQIIENASGYTQLLKQHILKEDRILYPMSDRILTSDDQKELLEDFERVEKEEMGDGVHQKYQKLVEILEKELGI
jgi:hemerythrin-like domain-containing protein